MPISPSLKDQEMFIRTIFKRNNPEELKKLDAAVEDPELNPDVRKLILQIRDEFKTIDKNLSTNGGAGLNPDEIGSGIRQIARKPALALLDGDTDSSIPGPTFRN